MTTYTSGLRLTNQDTGANANTWGDITDDNFEFLDDAITGRVSVDLTGASSHTLTNNNGSSDEARQAEIYIHGIPTSANSVIVPASRKFYGVKAAHTSVAGGVTVRTAAGTGVNLLTGDKGIIFCDGASVEFYAQPFIATSALDPSENLADLEDASAARDNLGVDYSTIATNVVSAIFEVMMPVGTLYSNRTDGTNPGTLIGFGTWTSAGMARVPIGVGMGIDINGVSVFISAETCGGEYEHTQTTAELVKHGHPTRFSPQSTDFTESTGGIAMDANGQNYPAHTGALADTPGDQIGAAGSSTAFNIQQPWYSVYQWVRTS